MATATAKKKVTRSNSIDMTRTDYEVLDAPPEFAAAGRRPKSGLRLRVEALNVGQWINTELDKDRDLVNVRSMVQNVQKELVGHKFTVRRNPEGTIFIGRSV